MLFGSHISIAGGVHLAPERAHIVGCEVMQIFSRSPRGGNPPLLTKEVVKEFKKNCNIFNIKETYIHAPYFINLASKNNNIRWSSISILKQELERGTQLDVTHLMTHLGSAKDYGRKKSVEKVIHAVHNILKKYQGSTTLLLEQSAGAGGENGIIGGLLDELGYIFHKVTALNKKYNKKLGICIDTCHAFAMGYDLRNKNVVNSFVKKIERTIGVSNVKLLHFNDSKFGCGEHKDRHEHIGEGSIGMEGFMALVNHPDLKQLNVILETPKNKTGSLDKKNIKLLKQFRKKYNFINVSKKDLM